MPQIKAEDKAIEQRVFGVQAYINQAFDHSSLYGLWNKSWPADKASGKRDDAIDKNADAPLINSAKGVLGYVNKSENLQQK